MVNILGRTVNAVRGIGHNDLDGQVSVKLSEYYLGDLVGMPVLSLNHVSNYKVDETIMEVLQLLEKDTLLVITDVSPSLKVAEAIQEKYEQGYAIMLFDHHKTALELNQYEWSHVVVEENWKLMSGTNLYFDFLINNFSVEEDKQVTVDVLASLVELVRSYDTWDWFNAPEKNLYAKGLNDWFYLVGSVEFDKWVKERISYLVSCGYRNFSFNEEVLLELEKENMRIEKYFNSKSKKLQTRSYENVSFGIVSVEQYHSELGNMLAEAYPELTFIAMVDVDNDKVSLRTIKDYDVSVIAKKYKGGGHSKSAGFPLTKENIALFTPHKLAIQYAEIAYT